MSESKGQEIVEKLLTFIEMVSNRKLKFSSIVDMNTGKTSDPTDRMVAAVDATLRAAKVEGLREALHIIKCDPENMRGTNWVDHDDVEALEARIAELEQAAQIEEGE